MQLLQKYVRNIMTTVMALLPVDNDENVAVALQMLVELHKSFRQRRAEGGATPGAADDGQPPMEAHVGPYLEFVRKVGWSSRS